MRTSTLSRVSSVFGLLVACGTAAADPLLDNLAETTRDVTVLGTTEPDRIWAAQSFGTPRRVVLDSIELLLGNATADVDAVIELHSGADPSGPLLATFAVPSLLAAGLDVAMLSPSVPLTLDAGEVCDGFFRHQVTPEGSEMRAHRT